MDLTEVMSSTSSFLWSTVQNINYNASDLISVGNETVAVSNLTCMVGNATCGVSSTGKSEVGILRSRFNTAQAIICPILLVVGVVGNIFIVLTVSDSNFRRLTSRYSLCALAFSDSLLLLTNPFNQAFMLTVFNRDLRAISVVGCKLFFVAYRTGKMSASWFIVIVAVERFVAVIFPLHVKTLIKKTNIIASIITVYVCMFSVTGVWTFSVDIVGTMCFADVVRPDTVRLHKTFIMLAATTYSFLPLVILLTTTPPIIYTLVKQHRRRQAIARSPENALERSARHTSKTSFMLIGIILSYIVCVMPITFVLILTFWTNEHFFTSTKKEFIILSSVAQFFEQMNHSSNFLIYVLFSNQFRRRFLQKISCRKKKQTTLVSNGTATMTNNTYGETEAILVAGNFQHTVVV